MSLPSIFASRTLPWVLLALSVALNAFFIGGHVYTRSLAHHFDKYGDRSNALAERLGLSDQQRSAYRESRRNVGPKFRALRDEARPHVNKLWDEMAKADPDDKVIDQELKSIGDMRYGFERDALASARAFMKTLTPEQRKQFADYARERFPGPPGLGGKRPPHPPRPPEDPEK
ncbi:MAG: Spy/CpxP family protein refolding chaperone [Candidatus Eiseniibacteriota bacterium]